jgi:peptide/nickel transport system substrate-binding protein
MLLRRAVLAGITLPAAGALLAACGSDDAEPTGTAAPAGDSTATTAATTAPDDATPTEAMTEPSPTSGESAETPDSEATPSGGAFVEGGDLSMGQEFEEGVPGGHMIEGQSWISEVNFTGAGSSSHSHIRYIYEGIVERNPFTFEPVGRLAQAWEIAEDGLTITYFLREGVLWHDGEPFTAADVVASYEYLMNEDLASYAYTQLVESLAGVEAVDEYTVVFTATGTQAFFFDNVSFQLIASKHILDTIPPGEFNESGAGTGSDPSLVVGTGPFTLRERIDEDHLTVDRFDDYWNGVAYLDSYTVRYQDSADATIVGLLAGENDFAWEIQLTSLEELEQNGYTMNRWVFLGFDSVGLNLNPERTTLFQDKLVRQALYHAMDREQINLAAFEGHGLIEPTLLPPGTSYANPEGVTVLYEYDPEKAMALLDEAGWVVGADGIREKDGQRFSFTIKNANWPPWVNAAAVVQEQWRRVGVEAQTEIDDNFLYEDGEWDAVVWDYPFTAVAPRTFYYYRCGDPNNYSSYCNPEVDALVDQIVVELDEARRVELMTEWQNLVLEDLPYLPLYYIVGYMATHPRVHNPMRIDILTNMRWAVNKLWIEQ